MKFKHVLPVVLSVLFTESIHAEQVVVDFGTPVISTTSSPVKTDAMERGSVSIRLSSVESPADDEIFHKDWAMIQKTLQEIPEMPLVKAGLSVTGLSTPVVFGEFLKAVLLSPTFDGAVDTVLQNALVTVATGAVGFIPALSTFGLEEIVATKTASSTLGKAAGNLLKNSWDIFKTKASTLLARKSAAGDAETQPTIVKKVKGFLKNTKNRFVKAIAPTYVKVKRWFF